MRQVLGFLQWLGVALLVCALLAGAAVAGVFLTHPRDEAAYLRYVKEHDGASERQRKADQSRPPSTTLIVEGDQACEWLQRRSPALWRDGDEYQIDALAPVYAETMEVGGERLRDAVVLGAWNHLCPATRTLMAPHRPWERG